MLTYLAAPLRPNHVISLVRRETDPADWATFRVPLYFSKFDIRDYLYNLYNVETTGVRSWVRRPTAPTKNNAGRYVRPPAEKYMTVEMTKPFVWPEAPVDLSPWDAGLYNMREKMMKQEEEKRATQYKGGIPMASDNKLSYEEKKYRQLAADLLNGKKWTNGRTLDEKWDATKKTARESRPEGSEAKGQGAGEKKLDE